MILGGGANALLPQVKEEVESRWQERQHLDSARVALFKKKWPGKSSFMMRVTYWFAELIPQVPEEQWQDMAAGVKLNYWWKLDFRRCRR
jgi:hypothetical protein